MDIKLYSHYPLDEWTEQYDRQTDRFLYSTWFYKNIC